MACKIHYSGPAKVQKYFKPTEKDGKRSAFFRGRRLYGKQCKLPSGYVGVVMEETQDKRNTHQALVDAGEDEDADIDPGRLLAAVDRFDTLTVWSHETEPQSQTDPWISAVSEWAPLATLVS